MPELPDVTVYLEALERTVVGRRLERVRIANPFVLRSYDPPIEAASGRVVAGVRRVGKRVVLDLGEELFLVIHLMIAGRLRWRAPGVKLGMGAKAVLATFEFAEGSLYFTEAGTKRRASITLLKGEAALRGMDPGGIEPLESTAEQFHAALTRENHTLKRALADPHLFSGIGNAYSDEILHRARLSPLKLTSRLSDEEVTRLYDATRATLLDWTARLRAETGDGFPEKVTAFRDDMAVHGRYRLPCPVCGTPVQRIRYRDNETNYCPRCQTEGRLLADRALSRLLKEDWPRTVEELEG
jgi:formamidopyrimidine-DNA glycosylase